MRAQIEALAMQGAPSVSSLIEHDGKIEFQTRSIRSEVRVRTQRALAFAEVPDTVALVAWLHKDALIARWTAKSTPKPMMVARCRMNSGSSARAR